MASSSSKNRSGSWSLRILVRVLTLLLGILIFWLLGFLVNDIKSIAGPDYEAIETKHLDPERVRTRSELEREIADLKRTIDREREEQKLTGDGSQNLQRTINQLIDLQKLNLQRQTTPSDAEKADLSASLNLFLASQQKYEELNNSIARLSTRRAALEVQQRDVDQHLEQERKAAWEEYNHLTESHRLRLATYQLGVLIPLLVLGGYFLLKQREALYAPLLFAFSLATLVKVGLVVHEYFPSRIMKYVLTIALTGFVARLLVQLIRSLAFPKIDLRLRQYREAYERYLCPVCDYPIRSGPRTFLYWTRRTVHKVMPAAAVAAQEAYSCPNCGTKVFESCPSCGKIRHSLLPHCEHCGSKQEIA